MKQIYCTALALRRSNHDRHLEWTQNHVDWIERQWSNVLFTDKSRFGFCPNSRKVRVWRARGKVKKDEVLSESPYV